MIATQAEIDRYEYEASLEAWGRMIERRTRRRMAMRWFKPWPVAAIGGRVG